MDQVLTVLAELAGTECRLSLRIAGYIASDRAKWEAGINEIVARHKKRFRGIAVDFQWEAVSEAAEMAAIGEFLASLEEASLRGASANRPMGDFFAAEGLDPKELLPEAVAIGLNAFRQSLRSR